MLVGLAAAVPHKRRFAMKAAAMLGVVVMLWASHLSQAQTRPAALPSTKSTASQPVVVKYQGHPVTRAWLDQRYAQFADKISIVDGRFTDIGRELIEKPLVGSEPPDAGTLRYMKGKIANVESDGSLIVARGDITIHIKGSFPGKVDGSAFESALVYVGSIKTPGGETLQNFVVPKPLTREQFEAALNGGFQLVFYRVVKEPRVVGDLQGGGFSVRSTTHTEMVDKIVPTPIPAPN
jgi:hypothetical protein